MGINAVWIIHQIAIVKQILHFISEHYGDNWGYLNYIGNTVAVGHSLAVMNNRYTQTNMISAGDHKQTILCSKLVSLHRVPKRFQRDYTQRKR